MEHYIICFCIRLYYAARYFVMFDYILFITYYHTTILHGVIWFSLCDAMPVRPFDVPGTPVLALHSSPETVRSTPEAINTTFVLVCFS